MTCTSRNCKLQAKSAFLSKDTYRFNSGGWSSVNWLCQITRNFTTEFLNFNLQAEENYVRIQYSLKKLIPLRSFSAERFLFSCVSAHSCFASAHHFLAFPIFIFYRILFRILKIKLNHQSSVLSTGLKEKMFYLIILRWEVEVWQVAHSSDTEILYHMWA